MSRNLTSGILSKITSSQLHPFIAVEIFFPKNTTRIWGGYGTIRINSQDYLGVGTLGSISSINETTQNQASGLTLSLSGIPNDLLAVAMAEQYQGSSVNVFFGCLNDEHSVIESPINIFSGRMDVISLSEGAESSALTITVESRLIDLEKPRLRRYTSEDQKINFPDDKGLDFVASIQEINISWGSS